MPMCGGCISVSSVLALENIEHFYGESHTLWDVSLRVKEGACCCILGRNGVGKTTLLECIMGLQPIRSGRVALRGNPIHGITTEERALRGIGYVPQGRQIFPLLTVEENLRIGLPARADGALDIPAAVYDLFPVLKSMLHRRGGDLSGGQQQQLAIARALVTDPSLLVLDEPTEGIQPNLVQDIAAIIRRLNADQNLGVLLVEQKLPFARAVADSFYVLDRGRVVAEGAMTDLDDGAVRDYLSV